jgi:hypothetical protein
VTAGRWTILALILTAQTVSSVGPLGIWCVDRVGGYGGPWAGLALMMVGALGLLSLVRERPRLP